MTNKLSLFAHWSVRQKLNSVSSVRFSSVTPLCTRLQLMPVGKELILFLDLLERTSIIDHIKSI